MDGTSSDEKIENALQAASETADDWESRCHAIMSALGFDFGDLRDPWRPMPRYLDDSREPFDGKPILLLSRIHGVVQAWFSPGQWSDETPDHPREYDGPVWVCGDDAFQIEIEEGDELHHGEATHWRPMIPLPAGVEPWKS